jgi:hypothetical protein
MSQALNNIVCSLATADGCVAQGCSFRVAWPTVAWLLLLVLVPHNLLLLLLLL